MPASSAFLGIRVLGSQLRCSRHYAEAEMAEDHAENRMTAFDCEVVRNAYRKSVVERRISGRSRRQHARLLALELTDLDTIDPDILDWIVTREEGSDGYGHFS
jgi:hypothetical protein